MGRPFNPWKSKQKDSKSLKQWKTPGVFSGQSRVVTYINVQQLRQCEHVKQAQARENCSMEREGGHETPLIDEELLSIESYLETKNQFSLRMLPW